ncbi:MAG: urease accessory protein UreH [Acidobacteriia bacterium]|nr:urease accessory protein UreH [Terriglobia bacterium]
MNSAISLAVGLGFVLGLKHALDADHLIAVSTIVSEHKTIWRSALVGVLWGIGHTLSLLVVGVFVLVLRLSISPRMALSMEFSVALMLILLGANVLWKYRRGEHLHVHSHGQNSPLHLHFHSHVDASESSRSHHSVRMPKRPLWVGMVHGLAGSAALTLLVLTTLPTALSGLIYILVFGLGSIGGMLLMSTAISLPFVLTAQRFDRFNHHIRFAAGTLSALFGGFLAYQIAFVERLFR